MKLHLFLLQMSDLDDSNRVKGTYYVGKWVGGLGGVGGNMQYCFHFHPLTPSPLPTSWSTLAPSIHLKLGILYQFLAFGHIYKGELFWENVMARFFFILTFSRMASSLCPPLHPPLCPPSCSNPFTLQGLFLPMNKNTSLRGWLNFQFKMETSTHHRIECAFSLARATSFKLVTVVSYKVRSNKNEKVLWERTERHSCSI